MFLWTENQIKDKWSLPASQIKAFLQLLTMLELIFGVDKASYWNLTLRRYNLIYLGLASLGRRYSHIPSGFNIHIPLFLKQNLPLPDIT